MDKLKKFIHKINPCEAAEDSFCWRVLSTLFPDCWCCAGLRGVVYGVVLTILCIKVFKVLL